MDALPGMDDAGGMQEENQQQFHEFKRNESTPP
jgi:hypothetical protein